ncbi:Aste57867_1186 [Aphanomyces stellatus]|uniref:Aste57867_1186 protein n=1 Tax=Aphanomyces stellatus TaxID=120398 RepID=A0A485K8S3_9STRA|nr:hypothetical protein As57867_001185 [Aphanomyces stellatus]VFT78406.1 Aste57867_1186 [Aphanomyces stellatus]
MVVLASAVLAAMAITTSAQGVANWIGCDPHIDTCADGWACCVATNDCAHGFLTTTCRPPNDAGECATAANCSTTTPNVVPHWTGCHPDTDTCADGWACCIAVGDCNQGFHSTTCRPPNVVGECATTTNCVTLPPPVANWAACNPQNDTMLSTCRPGWLNGQCAATCATTPQSTTTMPPSTTTPSTTSASSSSSTGTLVVWCGIVGIGALVVAGVILILVRVPACCTRQGGVTKVTVVSPDVTIGNSLEGKLSLPQNPTTSGLSRDHEDILALWRLDENEIQPSRVLSRGAFGEVWVGSYRHTPVAIKKLLATRSLPDTVDTFVAEILLMARLECPYIVKFIGVSWFRKAEMMLVLEFMDQGDLRTKLETTTHAQFPYDEKLTCALSVIYGLAYLHTLDMPVIHRDIKSRNVVLDSVHGTKLTDFGVSREDSSETMTVGIGTFRWMAPEILTDSHYSLAADIYSFGVLLAELDTHLLPYSDQVNDKGKTLNDTAIMSCVMQGTIQPTFTPACPNVWLTLAKDCLSYDPTNRPTAGEVAHRLRDIQKDGSKLDVRLTSN